MSRPPPAYSPLTLGAIVGSVGAALTGAEQAREALSRDLGARFRAETTVVTGSGTHALQAALGMLQRSGSSETSGGRDEAVVALPAYSCFDLMTAAVSARVHVRFYDIDPVSLSPDLDSIRRVLSDGVSAVVAGNLYGYPLDWPALSAECSAAGVPLIEDAAQGIGTETPVGSGGALGAATVLSFGRGKGWTGGGGGALLLRASFIDSVEALPQGLAPGGLGVRSGVVTLVAWALGRPSLYRIPTSVPGLGLGETRYHEPTPTGSITGFSAALARRTANAAIEAVATRRDIARLWVEALESVGSDRSGLRVCHPVGGPEAATYLRLPVVADSPERATALVESGQDLGIAGGYPTPLHRLPQASSIRVSGHEDHPGSTELAACLITLPTHRWIDESTVARFLDLLDD